MKFTVKEANLHVKMVNGNPVMWLDNIFVGANGAWVHHIDYDECVINYFLDNTAEYMQQEVTLKKFGTKWLPSEVDYETGEEDYVISSYIPGSHQF